MNYRAVVKFKDGEQCVLDADSIIYDVYGDDGRGVIQLWRGENTLVGVYNLSDIIGVCVSASEKRGQ